MFRQEKQEKERRCMNLLTALIIERDRSRVYVVIAVRKYSNFLLIVPIKFN
jgi:hypothetical protein